MTEESLVGVGVSVSYFVEEIINQNIWSVLVTEKN